MNYEIYVALIQKHQGWLEPAGRDEWVAHFPSVWHREQFEREANDQ